jgi:transcription termination/antitermination protein NusG
MTDQDQTDNARENNQTTTEQETTAKESAETAEHEESQSAETENENNDSDTIDQPKTDQKNENTENEQNEEEEEGGLLSYKHSSLAGSSVEEKRTALKTSTGKQKSGTGRHWYVIHTYSGYEDAVEKALRQRIESLNMQDLIFDIIVPKEKTITIKKGEHITEKKRLFPGYVLVEMVVTDESWYVVRNTPNVTGFVGSGTTPVPVLPEELDIIKRHQKDEEPKFKISFSVGDNVIIEDGPFKSYEGIVDAVDDKKGKIKVLITIFDRETPVELDFVQVKKK